LVKNQKSYREKPPRKGVQKVRVGNRASEQLILFLNYPPPNLPKLTIRNTNLVVPLLTLVILISLTAPEFGTQMIFKNISPCGLRIVYVLLLLFSVQLLPLLVSMIRRLPKYQRKF
jgi:hypothetical protein